MPAESSRRSWLRWLPGALISLLAVYLLLRFVDLGGLRDAFRLIEPGYVAAAIGLTLAFTFLRAWAWRVLLNNQTGLLNAFLWNNAGYLLNNILPFRAGEIGRAIFMGRSIGISPMRVLSTIVIERAFDIVLAASIFLSMLPLVLGLDSARNAAVIMLVIVLVALTAMFLMACNHETVSTLLDRHLGRFSVMRRIVLPQVRALLQGLAALSNPRQVLLAFGLIAASWVVSLVQYWLMLRSVIPSAPFWWGVFTNSALALGIAIPSTPGALGVFEGAIVAALAALGVSSAAALAYAIAMHAIQFVTTGIVGAYALLREGQSLGELFSSLRARRETR